MLCTGSQLLPIDSESKFLVKIHNILDELALGQTVVALRYASLHDARIFFLQSPFPGLPRPVTNRMSGTAVQVSMHYRYTLTTYVLRSAPLSSVVHRPRQLAVSFVVLGFSFSFAINVIDDHQRLLNYRVRPFTLARISSDLMDPDGMLSR